MMKRSVRLAMANALDIYYKTARTEWVKEHPAMCVLNGSQYFWTLEIEDRIRDHGTEGVKSYMTLALSQIEDLILVVRGHPAHHRRHHHHHHSSSQSPSPPSSSPSHHHHRHRLIRLHLTVPATIVTAPPRDQVRGHLTKQQRMTVGALIVIEVHARDVVTRLINAKVAAVTDFDWIAQVRPPPPPPPPPPGERG
jgi:hypothetical protein